MEVILKIAGSLDIPVQAGGGIRDYDTVSKLINGGISRVILGTSAIYDPELVKSFLESWPDRIIAGIDSTGGKAAAKGWVDISEKSPAGLAKEMESMGVAEIIVTDIKTDGTLKGPNLALIKEVADSVKISVIASGGVSSIEDVKKLKALNLKNLTGVIVGKALYNKDIILSEAIKTARNGG